MKVHSLFCIIISILMACFMSNCNNNSSESQDSSYFDESEEYANERLEERREAIQSAERHEEKDGFVWYSYTYNKKKGIVSADGKILIWDNYDAISYLDDGKYFKLKNYNGTDIATQDFVVRVRSIDNVYKVDEGNDKQYWYNVIRSENGITKEGAYSKNWEQICPPIFDEIQYDRYHSSDDFKIFTAKLDRKKDEYNYIINYHLDNNGNLIEDDKPIYINYYIRRQEWGNGDVGESVESVRLVLFYDNYIIWRVRICPYCYRSEDGLSFYKYKSEKSQYYIYVDDNYNIRVEQIGGDPAPTKDTWIQILDRNGEPIYNSVYKKVMDKWAEYEKELSE